MVDGIITKQSPFVKLKGKNNLTGLDKLKKVIITLTQKLLSKALLIWCNQSGIRH